MRTAPVTTETFHDPGSKDGGTGSPGPRPRRAAGGRFADALRYDLPASLVVFLVAVPLSLGIAAASGAPIMAGLIAAAVGGIVAGSLGGSPLQVSGPAAGLTVIVAGLVDQFGWPATCAITAVAGVLQALLGLARFGRVALAIAPVVVHAMLAGIGITIVLQQFHVLLGAGSASSALGNIAAIPASVVAAEFAAAGLGITVIGTLLLWRRMPEPVRRVPGPLVAVIAATALSLPFGVDRITFSGSLTDSLSLPQLPAGNWSAAVIGAVTIALIASVESLLSAVAVDKMHHGPRTNFNRELMGQGAANVTSGLLGGMPVTGVIVRSATNLEAGARTRSSAVLHGVWVLVFSLLLAGLIQLIPESVLAGLLIIVGARLVRPADIRTARRTGDLPVYAVTLSIVVFANLLVGVLTGLLLAIALVLWRIARATVSAFPESGSDGAWRVVIDGSCSFLSLPRLSAVLAAVPAGTKVTLELDVDYLDHPVQDALDAWQTRHVATGGSVTVQEHGTASLDDAHASAPCRGDARSALRSGFAPWSAWQGRTSTPPSPEGDDAPALQPIMAGVENYHRRTAGLLQPHVGELATYQDPSTLFLTCADSRVVPNVITSSGPGDLFTVRNVGNVVGSPGTDAATDAALEFAVGKLSVETLVVCGHSGCGAMTALLDGGTGRQATGPIDVWLEHTRASLLAFRGGHPVQRAAAEAGFNAVDQLAMVNVAVQLERLQDHPSVAGALKSGAVQLTGLFYDIPTARVLQVTAEGIGHLHPLPQRLRTGDPVAAG